MLLSTVGYVVPDAAFGLCSEPPSHVRQACDASLQRLGVGIDSTFSIAWIRRFPLGTHNPGAMADLVRQGKVRL